MVGVVRLALYGASSTSPGYGPSIVDIRVLGIKEII
jgi:hypothetical protein